MTRRRTTAKSCFAEALSNTQTSSKTLYAVEHDKLVGSVFRRYQEPLCEGGIRNWLTSRYELIRRHAGPTILLSPPHFGSAYLIARHTDDAKTFVWIELTSHVQNDSIAQGNALAEALTRTFGLPLFSGALPYDYGVDLLRRHHKLLGPYTLALSGAEYAPDFARSLLNLHQDGSRVLLAFDALPEGFIVPDIALILDESMLRVTLGDVVAPGHLVDADIRRLLKESQGALATYLGKLHEALRLPTPKTPTPTAPTPTLDDYPALNTSTFLDLLKHKGLWLEALELAITHLPECVSKVLRDAGHFYLPTRVTPTPLEPLRGQQWA